MLNIFKIALVVLCLFGVLENQILYAGDNFNRDKLVAWCIVPFDAAKRTPEQRASMLKELGVTRCAYDWRQEHVSQFEEEILAYKKYGIEMFAFWGNHEAAFKLFEKYQLHPQIWQMIGDPKKESFAENLSACVQQLTPLAIRTKTLGCKLGIYNHGGWCGEPRNMTAVCQELHKLGYEHVGIVYNFHHGHDHIADWAESYELMRPYLICLNLNGMNKQANPKILGISKGEFESGMIKLILEKNYQGPIGILDHRPELDARESLVENLDGLNWVLKELEKSGSGGEKPATPLSLKEQQEAEFKLLASLLEDSRNKGNPLRGAKVFANHKFACVSCHRVGNVGGIVGPELTSILKQRKAEEVIRSVLWPKQEVKPEYINWQILTADGKNHTGYIVKKDDQEIILREPASTKQITIKAEDVLDEKPGSTVMPDKLTSGMTRQQQIDLYSFLLSLNGESPAQIKSMEALLQRGLNTAPIGFVYDQHPVIKENWPNREAFINRDRVYDFYTKQLENLRTLDVKPWTLRPAPELDGDKFGHWGNQNEESWKNNGWGYTQLPNVQSGVLQIPGFTIARGICLRLGNESEISVCFNPDNHGYPLVWKNGFVKYSDVRGGLMTGMKLDGEIISRDNQQIPREDAVYSYQGYYRYGNRIIFAYKKDSVEYLDAPWVQDGAFATEVAPKAQHSLNQALQGGPSSWPQILETNILNGTGKPYALDTFEVPFDNPWKALMYFSGHDFMPDGTAYLCTIQGDVWKVTGINSVQDTPHKVQWKRFAAGLSQPLGLKIVNNQIYVMCRDQLARLHDLNNDGEADFYECYCNKFKTSAGGHDYTCGLECDAAGNFYTATSQGLMMISQDGQQTKILATGFRNPDGLGIYPDGVVTVPCSEGNWTPASQVCAINSKSSQEIPHFGAGGPKNKQPPALPFFYSPRLVDNSSGGQIFVTSDKWGPLKDQLIHLSYGKASHMYILRDEVDGQLQGAVVPLTGDFKAGSHRGRFNPVDGQLYVTGMAGWGNYAPDDGCFQRVRFTGEKFQAPVSFHIHQNGIKLSFLEQIDPEVATNLHNVVAQCWNYRYSGAYGSPEYSPSHPGVLGHDVVDIEKIHLLADGKSLFIEIPELQPVNVLHLRLHVNQDGKFLTTHPSGTGHELFITVHKLDQPFTQFPGYQPVEKSTASHPIQLDMTIIEQRKPNPWGKPVADSKSLIIETGDNLSYKTKELHIKAGEKVALTLKNPDVVPHNWLLIKPDKLQEIGELSNRLIADPTAYATHYVPQSPDVIAYTDIINPDEQQTIFFTAPEQPGKYPYLCTFPGHWMVMNGIMIVE